jgi:hypothetical protein
MSRSLRWSCCAAAVVCFAALGGFTAAFGQYGGETNGWAPNDYSAAYAPYAASYNGESCNSGCAGGTCGPDCGCDAYGPSCGGGSCGDGGCYDGSCYGGDASCGCGDYGCSGYGGGDCYGGGCGGDTYGGDCGCDPYGGCGDCSCDPYIDNGVKCGRDLCLERRCRWPKCSVWGEYLYLQVSDVDVAYAQQQDGLGGAGTVPFGDIGTVGTDFESGYRVGGSIACGPCSDVFATYTNFDVDAQSSLAPPDVPAGVGAVGSLVQHPGAAITASTGPLDATYEIDLRMGDIMCRSMLKQGPRYITRWMVGGQYAHLDQDFTQTGFFAGGQTGTVDTRTSIDFDGGGLKAGIDGERWLGHGLSVYGRLTGAVMTGRFSSRYSMFNETTQSQMAAANWKDDRAISNVEYEFGLALTSMDCHWRASVGYMLSYWDNLVTTPEFITAVQNDNYTRVGDSMTFDGGVSRIEFRY